jgi:hypothetical protein
MRFAATRRGRRGTIIVPHPNLSAKAMPPLWQYFSRLLRQSRACASVLHLGVWVVTGVTREPWKFLREVGDPNREYREAVLVHERLTGVQVEPFD